MNKHSVNLNTMMASYRPGAIGALLDIYEQAIIDLKKTIEDIPDNALTIITDAKTTDENCRSIQTILTHVVSAAYSYATSIHNLKGYNAIRPEKTFHLTVREYLEDLSQAFIYTENVFKEINENEICEHNNSLKIKAGWGQLYDIEQMMEHAITHSLRHQLQIEKIKRRQLI